jgi:hypothetical protein
MHRDGHLQRRSRQFAARGFPRVRALAIDVAMPHRFLAILLTLFGSTAAADAACAPDAVAAGATCLDRYEASVWRVPGPAAAHAQLIEKIVRGTATRGDLGAGGAVALGASRDDYAPCADDGGGCEDLYAVSLPAVLPAASITWFQAQAACANSGKRLTTNAEWQIGANGSPDPGTDDGISDCNTTRGSAALTGERSRCVSTRGASDSVGNLSEWVADWTALATACPGWASFSDDAMCLAGANGTKPGPGAFVRGGSFSDGSAAGPLAIDGTLDPTRSEAFVGFRCARALPEPRGLLQLGAGLTAIAVLARRRR